MKKERKREIKDYSVYDDLDKERQGLFIKKGKLRIDVKRLKRSDFAYNISDEIVAQMGTRPRSTAYFFPAKEHRCDYNCNIFADYVDEITRLWNEEYKGAITKIRTPTQAGDDAFMGHITSGIFEHDECEIARTSHVIKREQSYSFVVNSMLAQFIHFAASIIEHTMLRVLYRNGFRSEKYSKRIMVTHLKEQYKINFEDIPNVLHYDRFYKLWNFLKHNSSDTYKKLKKEYPEILAEKEFKNGEFALGYVKLSEEVIMELLGNLKVFFNSFCENVFKEDTESAQWDYDDYFLCMHRDWRKNIEDPLGLNSIYGMD